LTGKTEPSKVLLRAQLAARYGLSRKALDLLLESSPAIFGGAGVVYELDLMMKAGQSYKVRDWLEPDYERKINSYHWVMARAAASCGEYLAADSELESTSKRLRGVMLAPGVVVPVRSAMAVNVARAALTRPVGGEGASGLAIAAYMHFKALYPLDGPEGAAKLLREEADLQVLRGLLALEAGEVEKARRHLRSALDVWNSATTVEAGGGLDFSARPIAQLMLRRMAHPRPYQQPSPAQSVGLSGRASYWNEAT
jgi:hypothetical protein